MKNRLIWLSFFTGALLTACFGGPSVPAQPTPGPVCVEPSGTQSALAYPAPNSTGIPDQFGQIVIGSSPALPSSWNVVVTTPVSPGGRGGATFTPAPTPLPSPAATPGFATPVYQSSSFGTLNFAGEVVQVFLNDTASNCTPLGPIGHFTTQ